LGRLRKEVIYSDVLVAGFGQDGMFTFDFPLCAESSRAGQPPREIAIFAGLALGPMLLGNTGMNWLSNFCPPISSI